MQYQVAIALNSQEDIQCVQVISETMSFSFHTFLIPPDAAAISECRSRRKMDLLILDLADKEIEQFAVRLRAHFPKLWMILLRGRETDPLAFCTDRRSILLDKPVSTIRMLHALHSAAAGLSQDLAAQPVAEA